LELNFVGKWVPRSRVEDPSQWEHAYSALKMTMNQLKHGAQYHFANLILDQLVRLSKNI